MVPAFIWENFDNIIMETQRRVLDPGFKEMVRNMNPVHAAIELGTVALDPGRRTGKTTYIINHAASSDVIIVPSRRFASGSGYMYQRKFFCANEYKYHPCPWRTEGLRPLTVYVDEPALVFKEMERYSLYEEFCHQGYTPLFVLLGRCI